MTKRGFFTQGDEVVLLALAVVVVVVGLFFWLNFANRAANLRPIDALRYE